MTRGKKKPRRGRKSSLTQTATATRRQTNTVVPAQPAALRYLRKHRPNPKYVNSPTGLKTSRSTRGSSHAIISPRPNGLRLSAAVPSLDNPPLAMPSRFNRRNNSARSIPSLDNVPLPMIPRSNKRINSSRSSPSLHNVPLPMTPRSDQGINYARSVPSLDNLPLPMPKRSNQRINSAKSVFRGDIRESETPSVTSSLSNLIPSSYGSGKRNRHRPNFLSEEWEVDRVMVGDGPRDRNGRVLRKGLFYCASGYQVDAEGFHAVGYNSLEIHKVGAGRLKHLNVDCVTALSKRRPRPSPPVVDGSRPSSINRTFVRDLYRDWYQGNPGTAILTHAVSGARPLTDLTKPFIMQELGSLFEHENDGLCMRSALLNGVWRLQRREAASTLRPKLDQEKPFFQSIGQMHLALHEHRMKIDMIKARHNMYDFDGCAACVKGGFLFRLQRSGKHCTEGLEHAIAVDCEARLILDSAERFSLRLTARSLLICAGNSDRYSKIIEVRELRNSRGHE